jgi:hypothetical protein
MHSYIEFEDPTDPGTYIDVSENCHNVQNAFTRDNVDTSTFGQGDKTNINGMRDGTFSVDYLTDPALRDLLWSIFLSDDPVRVRYGPEGNGTGAERQTAYFNMEGFGDGGSTTTAVGGSVSFHRTGATTRDTWS